MRNVLIGGGLFIFATTPSLARTFGGYECTVDCSGHKAGYESPKPKTSQTRKAVRQSCAAGPLEIHFTSGAWLTSRTSARR